MLSSKNLSISQKLKAIILLACTLVLFLVSVLVFTAEWISFRSNLLSNISTLTRVVSANSTAAIAFEDPGTAREILAAFAAEPSVLQANFLNLDNSVYASYDRRTKEAGANENTGVESIFNHRAGGFKVGARGETYRFSKNHLDLIRSISIDNQIIGRVHIRASLTSLQTRLKWFAVFLAASMAIFIFLAYLVSGQLQRIISGPILRLAHHMQTVSREKNYAIRAKASGNDEVGILINGFNEMLEQTQLRDEELNRQRNRLSDLVSKRTAELKISEEQKQQLLFQQTIQEAYGKIVGLLNSIDISEILEKSLNEIVPQSGSHWGAFYLAGENSNSLKLTKSVWDDAATDADTPIPFFLEASDQLANRVFNSQSEASEPLPDSERRSRGQLNSLAAFPLGFQNKPLGVLVLAAEQTFSGWHLSFLKNTSRQLGVALHNALTFQELRHQSMELEQRNIALSKASQLKSEFLANMSHELRTPLNHIIGFTDLVVGKKFGDINEAQEEYLNDVLTSSHHLLELINDILDIAKVEAGKVELDWSTVKVSQTLSGSLTMVREKARKNGCQLICEENDTPEVFYADERKFKQVLFNLLSNAVKFTPNGGEIRLSSQIVDYQWPEKHVPEIFRKKIIENLERDCNGYLHVSVKDNGIGIKPDSLKSIFEVFQQEDKSTTTKFGGTGLGLSLSKQFIELHHGGIWVESSPGEGSNFSFLLPIYEADPSQRGLDAPSRSVQKDAPMVLVVDDDEKICALMSYILKEEGCDVRTSLNGESAIEKATELKPDMVFLDVMLPIRSGWEVLNRLKSDERTADIPVVICSAIEDRQQAISLGAADSIVKPVMKDDLLRCLKTAVMQPAVPAQNLAN